MVHWDSYIARYGVSRHQEEYESKEVRNRVEIELLKFLASICVIVQKNRPKPVDFKINKVRLSETFSSHRRAYLLSLNQTNKRESLSMTPSILEEYFKNRLGIIAVHKLDDNRNFLFYPDDISKILHSRGIPMSYHDIFDEAQFEKQILEIVEYPDYV
jgi:hypothetical protein